MWRAKQSRLDLFLHANHFRTSTFIAHSDACCNRLTLTARQNSHPSQDLACVGRSVRAVESPLVRGPAAHRAAVIRQARAPAARYPAADCPAAFQAAVHSVCQVLPAESPEVRSASCIIDSSLLEGRQHFRCDDVPRCVTIDQAYSGV
jgi:hypothetical protein